MIFLSCKEDLYTYNAYHLAKAFFPEEEVRQTVNRGLGETLRMEFPDGRILPVVVDEPYVVAGPFEVVFQSESLEYAAIVGMQGEGQ